MTKHKTTPRQTNALAALLVKASKVAPGPDAPKTRITIRLDADVVEFFRNTGPGYQTRINEILRLVVEHN